MLPCDSDRGIFHARRAGHMAGGPGTAGGGHSLALSRHLQIELQELHVLAHQVTGQVDRRCSSREARASRKGFLGCWIFKIIDGRLGEGDGQLYVALSETSLVNQTLLGNASGAPRWFAAARRVPSIRSMGPRPCERADDKGPGPREGAHLPSSHCRLTPAQRQRSE